MKLIHPRWLMSKTIQTGVVVLAIGGLVFAFWLAFFSDSPERVAQRVRLAEDHLPAIRREVQSHPKFENMFLTVGTKGGGFIFVSGTVDTEKDLVELQKLVAAQRPPIRVVYSVNVRGP
jgi:hypothetical protein